MSEMVSLPNFHLNHPKNYFGYTIAIAAGGSAETASQLMEQSTAEGKKITSDINGARTGAAHLGLIIDTGRSPDLTDLGQRVASFAKTEYASYQDALDVLRTLFRSRAVFVERLPKWKAVTQDIVLQEPGIARFVTLLQEIHVDRSDPPNAELSYPVLIQEVYHRDPEFALECFIIDEVSAQQRVPTLDWHPTGSNSAPEALWDRALYRRSTVHQFKSLLAHAGILTTKGRDAANLELSVDSPRFRWGLTPEFRQKELPAIRADSELEQPDIEEQALDYKRPDRIETTTSRIIRNTQLVKALKAEYEYRCQVCGDRRQRATEEYYVEGHHLKPLSEDGPDVRENIIVVCPNCHADLDYGMMAIDSETFSVNHIYDDVIDNAELEVHDDHDLDPNFIAYHNTHFRSSLL